MTKQELIDFETDIKNEFLAAKIRAPVHLSGGNEDQLIEIFKSIKPTDWVFSTHRSHYHALLHGIPKDWLKQEIMEGRSIHIFNKEHKFLSTAIVGGNCSIAVGVAMGAKMKQTGEHVWCFVGEMAAEMGIFHECHKYAIGHDLPITFVIEDNGLSTNTPTLETWGISDCLYDKVLRYTYTRVYPHINCGQWVVFK